MRFDEAQREFRVAYRDGYMGPFVAGALWLASAALGTWGSRTQAVLMLVLGGALIFPIGLLMLRLTGVRATVSKDNPLTPLAMQVAFTVPLAIPLILAATSGRPEWFYSGFLIIVGAHYFAFVTLYGRPIYLVAGGAMVAAGVALPLLAPGQFAIGGWLGGGMLVLLGAVLLVTNARAGLTAPPRT